jgi:hypothetical protein
MITGTRNSPIGTRLVSIKAGWYEVIDNKECWSFQEKRVLDGFSICHSTVRSWKMRK